MAEKDVVETDRLDLRDDPAVLSAPSVSPAYGCGTAVTVTGFVPHAKLELEIAGASVATAQAGYPDPDGYTFTGVGPLTPAEVIRARQEAGGVTGPWSAPRTVADHGQEYPAGPPRPEIAPSPVFECGSRTGVANLLTGCNVWIIADGTEVGRVDGAEEHQGVNVNPDYGPNQKVRAWAELCGDPSPPSLEYTSGPAPNPLPTPAIDDVFDGGERIRVTNLVNGARFRVTRGSSTSGAYRTWGGAHLVTMAPPVSTGEAIEVAQTMCPSNPPSDPGSTVVRPCSELPAPDVHPIEVGATVVVVTGWVAGAEIKVFQGPQKIGDGGPPVVVLTQPIKPDTPVYVVQVVGTCTSRFARVLTPRCVEPPTGGDPAGRNLFPVGFKAYADGPYKGTVYYPAEDDGEGAPFNARWAGLGRSPIVVMAHGNHYTYYDPKNREQESCGDPGGWTEIGNHTGYRYLQTQLARMGFVAVSVNCNATNCTSNTLQNIEDRAELILGSLNHFKDLDSSGDATFGDRIDFGRVGFMGHSRGGEAVVIAGNQAGAIGATTRAVISLAPVNHQVYVPGDYAFMTILPANDGDVSSNPGAIFYDLARPEPLKSQIYVDYADHNYFNREWVLDEDMRLPPDVLDRVACERILSRYGCALFRTFMMGHDLADYLTYRRHPAGIDVSKVHLSFEWKDQVLVDDHEQPSGIGTNSMGQTTSQSMGLSADEYHLSPGGTYSPSTFYGDTRGMVIEGRSGGTFRSPLDASYDLSADGGKLFEIWLRVAEVSNGGSNPSEATGFELGIEDGSGRRAWADSDAVGGVPRPFDHGPPSGTKSMMSTLRFPIRCFRPEEGRVETADIVALLIRLRRPDPRPLAVDVLQIVKT